MSDEVGAPHTASYEWPRSKELDAAIAFVIAAAKAPKKKPLIHNGRKHPNPYRSQA